MNAVGIDVSKGKSMIAVMQPRGVVAAEPFEIAHTESELGKLARFLKSLPGETKVVMESTGRYSEPIARYLYGQGLFVSVVNAILIHNYGGNTTVRKIKTDKKDAVKIANWALDHWPDLRKYIPEEDIRRMLKVYNRQYNQYNKLKVMLKNSLIALLDQTFPGINRLFTSPPRKSDGHEKWVDFALKFWHCECVCSGSKKKFTERYAAWCAKAGYHFSMEKASEIYAAACGNVGLFPKNDVTKALITNAILQLLRFEESIRELQVEMDRLSSLLPEYEVVQSLYGVGPVYGAQLMAEIGDIGKFNSKKELIGFAGIDPPPNQSGAVDVKSRSISKRGSADLRKTLFQIMTIILQNSPPDEPVYQFLDKKRSEGKPYKVYMIAAANKFLRIYYARVKENLCSQGCPSA